MWELKEPKPVKLLIGILAADANALEAARRAVEAEFGAIDMKSDVWPFTQTDYYKEQSGEHILKQFVSFKKLIGPGELAEIKHKTNRLEQQLAEKLKLGLARPVNLDPGLIEASKLVLATTKNYSHRIYIGDRMYAEVTLVFDKGKWRPFEHTYPDYRQDGYHKFFSKIRTRLIEQLRETEID